MKNKEVKIVKVYEQANGEKIAVSMLKTAAGMVSYFQPSTDISRHGTIEGEIASAWGKLPIVLVSWLEFKALKKQYDVVEYAAPVYCHHEREKKTRPDAAALKLYKAFATDEANPQRDEEGNFIKITVDNYTFYSGEGAWMLKELKRNFNFTKADIAAALALNIDEPQQQPEPAAAPVEDIEAAVVAHFEDLAAHAPADNPAADILRAGIETGKVIICSVPKAEPTTPASEKTEPTPAPVKKQKELAEYHGAIVEIIEHREGDAIIKYKYGAGGLANYEDLKPTTAKKTALPEWLQSFCILETESGIFRLDAVGQKNMHYYRPDGFYYSSSVARFIDSFGHTVKNWHIDPEFAPEETEPDPDAIGEIVTIPAEQKTAPTDAEVMETAARIRANYEALQADIEAEREQAAAAFAEAITAYCEELSRPEPLAWEPETIIIPFEPRPAAEMEQPRRRHRLNIAPRLSRWLHSARWVAVAFVVCLLSGLLLGMNTSTAADDIAAAYELAPVTVTAEAPDTFIEDEAPRLIEDKAPCLIEDKAPAPSPVKKLAAPSPVKNAAADAVTLPDQKTADDMATATAPAADDADSLTTAPAAPMAPAADADGLTICEGTPWAYTMMNWA